MNTARAPIQEQIEIVEMSVAAVLQTMSCRREPEPRETQPEVFSTLTLLKIAGKRLTFRNAIIRNGNPMSVGAHLSEALTGKKSRERI